jgi:hypothetical protein
LGALTCLPIHLNQPHTSMQRADWRPFVPTCLDCLQQGCVQHEAHTLLHRYCIPAHSRWLHPKLLCPTNVAQLLLQLLR